MRAFFLGVLAVILSVFSVSAQDDKPVNWKVEAKKVGENQFQISAEAKMKDGFHIWALNAGGDGSLINTNIDLTSKGITWNDHTWNASKRPKSERYEYIDGAVNYFERSVTFTRNFTVKAGVNKVEGQITYQTCNEMMCYPPQDIPFSLELK